MSLQDTLNNHLKEAMRSRDEISLGTLRMLKSSIKNKAIELKQDELADEEILVVIKKEVKKREDAMESFAKAGRDELAEKEKAEAEILQKYLPAMMSEEDISKIVDEVIASAENNFGAVMKAVMTKTKGQADGKMVQKLVKQKLE